MIKLPDNTIGKVLRAVLQKSLYPLSDEHYICLYYYILRGRSPKEFYTPKTFHDKIQWLKIYYHNDLLHRLVDKLAVRKYVESKIGEKYLNELYFSGDTISFEQYEALPDKFVLKATHGSGMNLLCSDKNNTPFSIVKKTINVWKAVDYYKTRREWAYKGIPRRIICENFLTDSDGKIPVDYKFYCYNGTPEYIQVDIDRYTNHKRVYYDCNWKKSKMVDFDRYKMGDVDKPATLKKMLTIASKLSKGLPFARIDLYSLSGNKVVFGEITIYSGSGSTPFTDPKYNYKYGKMIKTKRIG